MNRKYSVSFLDMLHYGLQIIGGQLVGALIYFMISSVASQIQYDQFMNSDVKNMSDFITPGMRIFNGIVVFLGYFIVPLIFQAMFVKTKASDQYENTDNPRRWLTKGLEYMLPGTIICLIYSVATIPFGIGFYRPLAVFGSFLDFSNLTSAYIFYALMGILCFACHTAVLLAVYRHFWLAWGRSKDEGKLRMSEDAYSSYEPKN